MIIFLLKETTAKAHQEGEKGNSGSFVTLCCVAQ